MTRTKLLLLLATAIAVVVKGFALDANHFAPHSALAEGHWVKVRVDSTGVQQLSYEQLREAGLSHPERVSVHGFGATALTSSTFTADLPDDLPRIATLHHSDKIYFYGEAGVTDVPNHAGEFDHRTNVYSLSGYYYLTDSSEADEPEPVAYTPSANAPIATHLSCAVIENERTNRWELGAEWHDDPLPKASAARSYSFPIDSAVAGGAAELRYRWVTDNPQTITLTFDPSMDAEGDLTSAITSVAYDRTPGTGSVKLHIPEGFNERLMVDISAASTTGDPSMDWLTLSYKANNSLATTPQRTLHFAPTAAGECIAIDSDSPVEAWDVSRSWAVRRLTPGADGRSFTLPEAHGNDITIAAFRTDGSMIEPVIIGPVECHDLHGMDVPDAVIVAHPLLLSHAEQLAQYHRDIQGLDVVAINAEQIYDEFGSGTHSAYAVRLLAKMLFDRQPGKLSALILYGGGSYDQRAIVNHGPTLPSYECDIVSLMSDEVNSYLTDACFGMFADGFIPAKLYQTIPDIAVGRIPATSLDEATIFNAKALARLQEKDAATRYGRMVLMSDFGDDSEHSRYAESHAGVYEALPGAVIHKIYTDFYTPTLNTDRPQARQDLYARLAEGVGLWDYVGHGGFGTLTSQPWVRSDNLPEQESAYPTLGMFATCLVATFDRNVIYMGRPLLFNPKGGCYSLIANTRSSQSSYNNQFNRNLLRHYLAAKPGATVGSLWLETITSTLKNYRYNTYGAINTIKYVLLGDPLLPLGVPDRKLTIASTGLSETLLKPLQPIKISGKVTDANGLTDTEFEGMVTLEAYADSTAIHMLGRADRSARGDEINLSDRRLAMTAAVVTNGCFEATLILPATLSSAVEPRTMRLIGTAMTADSAHIAVGDLRKLQYQPYADDTPGEPEQLPAIQAMTLNGSPLPGVTGATPMLEATITGGSMGLCTTSAGTIAPPLRLTLDGTKRLGGYSLKPLPDGTWNMALTLPTLPDGRHTVTLIAADNAGNRTESSLSFTVINAEATITLSANLAEPIARESMSFTWTHTFASTPDRLTLRVTDAMGTTKLNADVEPADSAYEWNLHDANGKHLAAGRYSAVMIGRSGPRYAASQPIDFTILP